MQLVKKLGGELTFDSDETRGSSFKFTVKLKKTIELVRDQIQNQSQQAAISNESYSTFNEQNV